MSLVSIRFSITTLSVSRFERAWRMATRAMAVLAGLLTILSPADAGAQRSGAEATLSDSATAAEILRSTCGSEVLTRGDGMLRGTVTDASGRRLGSVAITIGWRPDSATRPEGKPASGAFRERAIGVFSDRQGAWRACGVPLGIPLAVRGAADEGADERVATLDRRHPLGTLELVLRNASDPSGAGRSTRSTALVVISVVDRAGVALSDVSIEIAPGSGSLRHVATDSAGRAMVPALEPGAARIRTRRIGYRSGEVLVALDAGRNTLPLVLDEAKPPVLAAVRIIGDREILPRHQEFETRRLLRQTTASITAEDIEKRNPADTWQMLTTVSAMKVIPYASGVFAMSNRGQRAVQRKGAFGQILVPCWYRLMIDGVALPDSMPDLGRLPTPSQIHGIEVFGGPATIPPQYNSTIGGSQGDNGTNTCGLIAVWTK
jgi:hypothetical protein